MSFQGGSRPPCPTHLDLPMSGNSLVPHRADLTLGKTAYCILVARCYGRMRFLVQTRHFLQSKSYACTLLTRAVCSADVTMNYTCSSILQQHREVGLLTPAVKLLSPMLHGHSYNFLVLNKCQEKVPRWVTSLNKKPVLVKCFRWY